ncbi:MAG: DUF805 domain-containing protein [Saprospiraceae bacterium]|nr:DUF805 domain-containing protein [Saprospiraceae bacterium]
MQQILRWVKIKGRASRMEFWGLLLFIIFVLLVFGYLGELIEFRMLPAYLGLVLLIPFLATGMRRMQDAGKPGLLFFIPFYNLYIALNPGEPQTNAYGPDPRPAKS